MSIKTMTSIKSITNKYQSSTVKWINRSSKRLSIMMTAIILILINLILTHSVNGLSSIDESESRKLFGGYRITPKFCRASKTLPKSDPRSEGPTICMFNHECAQRNGEVVGACMDGFLFGACCQVPGIVDTTLIQTAQKRPQPSQTSSSNLAAAYETFGSQQVNSNEQINNNGPTGSFYDIGSELENDSIQLDNNNNNYNTNTLIQDNNKNQFYVENESVLVSSPSTNQFSQNPQQRPIIQIISSSNNTNLNQPAEFSTELPMKISQGQYGYTSEDSIIIHSSTTNKPQKLNPNDILNNGEFTHSDITHPGAESILIEDDLQFSTGYGPSTVYVPAPEHIQQQSTEKIVMNHHQKPVFKPKPTSIDSSTTKKPNNNNNGYVLVQTITNSNTKHPSKRPITEDGMTTNNIESIESIILMLNESNHGPSYNLFNSTTESAKITFSSSFGTRKPEITTNTNINNFDNYNPTNYYITTNQLPIDSDSSTHIPISSSVRPTFSNHYISSSSSTPIPLTTLQPPLIQSDGNIVTIKLPTPTTTSRPTISTTQQHYIISSTNHPIIITSSGTKRPTITAFKRPPGQNNFNNNNNEIIITPTRKPGTRRPINKPPSTSYVTGPTPPRLPSTVTFTGGSSTLPTQSNDDNVKIDVGVSGGGGGGINGGNTNNYLSPQYGSSTQKINIIENVQQSVSNDGYKPMYVQLVPISTTQRPHPTVIITPKPTISNLGTSTVPSSPWTQRPNIIKYTTIPTHKQPSTSYIYSPIVTRRPDYSSSTTEYVSLPPISSNDFDDPGYYGIQLGSNTNRPLHDYNPLSVTENVYTSITNNDDRPVFPGYYGPTLPSYSTFNVPTAAVEKNDEEEETYTSPNDFVNFPPVRNPNLNMSATSSSVTTDFDMSTPAFVEDIILKDKMSLLVNKIVDSLQGNFEALADLVEDDNSTRTDVSTTAKPTKSTQTQTKQTTKVVTTRRPITKKTPKPISPHRATSPKPLTTKRITTTTTKKPIVTKKPAITRRPAATQYTTKKPTKLTSKPAKTTKPSKATKPTRKVTTTTTTTIAPAADEIVEENIEENEIEEDETAEETRKIQCGVRPHVKSGRIVGGKGATFGEWPWQVLVRESTWLGLFTKNKCGGVLITNKFVMTAAHCQPGFLASLVAVFGEFDISGDLETKRSVTKNVKRVVVHRQYDAATFENDLALLELESVINYDTHIVPICMPTDAADFTGRMATVTGWGRLKYGGGVPSVLQEVQVPIIENSVCQEMFHTAGHNKKILTSFLCAGYANGQKDSCEGDSGGPLVLQRSDGRWELAGTVSHGIKCAAPYLPGVYMRTTFYKPWLKSVTGIK